jgi:periplasmic copper chaperone A
MRRRIVTFVLLLAGLVLLAAPAQAHVEVSPTELPEASSQELVFSYHHGCDGLATDGLEILLPEGVEATSMGGPEGWQSTIEERDAGQVMVWSGPEMPDGVEAEHPVELDLPAGAGTTLYFPTIQRCGPDNQVRWVEIPAEGQDPGELAEPAPAVLLVDNPDATTSSAAETTTTMTTTAETTTTAEATTTTTATATTAAPDTTAPSTGSTASATTNPPSPSTTTAEPEGGGTLPVALAVGGAAVVAAGAYALARSRNKQ